MPQIRDYCLCCRQETICRLQVTCLGVELVGQPRRVAPALLTECLTCGWEVYRVLEEGPAREAPPRHIYTC